MILRQKVAAAASMVGGVAATTVFASAVLFPALAAHASSLPPNCNATQDTGSTSSTGHLISVANGSCYTNNNQTIQARVYKDVSGTDPQIGNGSTKTGPGPYTTPDDECNNHVVATYYGMSLWYGDMDHNNQSAHTRQTPC